MSDHATPPATIVTRPDGETYTVIDQHYEQIRSDRESLNLYRSRAANYREAADKLLEAARLLEEECRPIEDRLTKARDFCQASLSDSPPSERASSVLSTVQQLASEALPVVQQLPAYNQGLTNGNANGNGAVYTRHMGLQYVNAPATPPSPHREHRESFARCERVRGLTPAAGNYPPPERHQTGTPVSAHTYAPPYPGGRPLKRSRSMVEEDELEEDRKSSPRSLASTDGMVMKMLPHEQTAPPVRKQGKFTDDDRHKIAAYLATTTSRAQNGGIDWKQFALSNPKYDATGWRTQYHSRKHKIDPLIETYRPQPSQLSHAHAQPQLPAQHPYVTGHSAHTPSVQAQPSPPSAYAQPAPAYAQPEGYAKADDGRSLYAAPEPDRRMAFPAPESAGYASADTTTYVSHSPARTPERTSDVRDEPMPMPVDEPSHRAADADEPPAPPIATVSAAESG
ncbi:hypothetical protein CALCODRAFT_332066 [Calocera cornea HHB12733]|uniref:Myb-like domain-containing protein n=1 Tax=Calocera cornea HHB12733 TaxID=1353952 RepID=A0A165F2X1_9BASI|nr:hypothetical protein CALCODRAFT_332066 [Calocera cornea HHB12733]